MGGSGQVWATKSSARGAHRWEVGTHEVAVRLGNEISPMLKVTIVPEQELAEFLAQREQAENADADAAEEEAETPAEEPVAELDATVLEEPGEQQ